MGKIAIFFASERFDGIRKYLNMINFSEVPRRTLIIYISIAGIINTLLLSVLNSAANENNSENIDFLKLTLFAACLIVFYITKVFSLLSSVKAVENSIYEVRNRILTKLKSCDLRLLEGIGRDEIYTRFSNDTTDISFSASILINTCQSIVMLFFTLIYILILSKSAFLFTILIITLSILYFLKKQGNQMRLMEQAHLKEITLYGFLDHILLGFKELNINRAKRNALFSEVDEVLHESKKLKTQFGSVFSKNLILNEMSLYILLGFIVFILPDYFSIGEGILPRVTTAILFLIVPITTIVGSLQPIGKGIQAVDRIEKLESKLENIEQPATAPTEVPVLESISLEDITYDYWDQEHRKTFTLGPVNLKIQKGEHICIMGGNGSGKSTLFKLISTLYTPEQGKMYYNNIEITRETREYIRSQMSIIFTDFHLFPKVYGISEVNKTKANEYISLLGLSEKVTFNDDCSFNTMSLSTGQRKRLSLITLMLENKEIFLLDEVTADQDPEFRNFFYEVLMAQWKKEGKTILLISHDERYTKYFDKVVRMEYGKIYQAES